MGKQKNNKKTIEIRPPEGYTITDSGVELVESALRRMGLDPNDRNVKPDMAEFTKAINAVISEQRNESLSKLKRTS